MDDGTQGKDLVRRWFTVGMNSGSLALAIPLSEEIFADDFVDHDGLGSGTNTRGEWQDSILRRVFGAFTNIDVHLEQLFAEQDRVAVRYVFHGTHTGPFGAIPPTQRRIHHSENEIYRVAGGRIVESWGEGDWLGTMRQLGAIPA